LSPFLILGLTPPLYSSPHHTPFILFFSKRFSSVSFPPLLVCPCPPPASDPLDYYLMPMGNRESFASEVLSLLLRPSTLPLRVWKDTSPSPPLLFLGRLHPNEAVFDPLFFFVVYYLEPPRVLFPYAHPPGSTLRVFLFSENRRAHFLHFLPFGPFLLVLFACTHPRDRFALPSCMCFRSSCIVLCPSGPGFKSSPSSPLFCGYLYNPPVLARTGSLHPLCQQSSSLFSGDQ